MGIIVETAVYKHIASFYYPVAPKIGYYREKRGNKEVDIIVALPRRRILVEVKYREDTTLEKNSALMLLANQQETLGAILVTKRAEDFGVVPSETKVRIVKIPAFAFLYLLGHAEKEGRRAD